MKIVASRKILLHNLELLQKAAWIEGNAKYTKVTCFVLKEGNLRLMAGSGPVVVSIQVEAEVEGDGYFFADYAFLSLLKVMRGETVTLSIGKRLSLVDDRKARSYLNLIDLPFVYAPADAVVFPESISADLTLEVEQMRELARLSLLFKPTVGMMWVGLTVKDGEAVGSVQSSETGGVEAIPLCAAEGVVEACYGPQTLQALLSLCSERCRLIIPENPLSPATVCDPDNDGWWGIILPVAK